MTLLQLNKTAIWIGVIGLTLTMSSSLVFSSSFSSEPKVEGGIQYFSQPEMDYWKKSETSKNTKIPEGSSPTPRSVTEKDSSFPWKKYLDPKNDEFFREGEYLPPAPFMEIARDPSDENIDHWFKYLEAKNEITRRLQAKLSEYTAQHSSDNSLSASTHIPPVQIPQSPSLNVDARRFRLRLYFDSKCPHCERMIETLKGLGQRGYSIELRQIDSNTQARSRIPFPVTGATTAELKQYKIENVPLLLVGDLKARTFFTIQGYQTEDSVLKALSEFSKTKQEGVSL